MLVEKEMGRWAVVVQSEMDAPGGMQVCLGVVEGEEATACEGREQAPKSCSGESFSSCL